MKKKFSLILVFLMVVLQITAQENKSSSMKSVTLKVTELQSAESAKKIENILGKYPGKIFLKKSDLQGKTIQVEFAEGILQQDIVDILLREGIHAAASQDKTVDNNLKSTTFYIRKMKTDSDAQKLKTLFAGNEQKYFSSEINLSNQTLTLYYVADVKESEVLQQLSQAGYFAFFVNDNNKIFLNNNNELKTVELKQGEINKN